MITFLNFEANPHLATMPLDCSAVVVKVCDGESTRKNLVHLHSEKIKKSIKKSQEK